VQLRQPKIQLVTENVAPGARQRPDQRAPRDRISRRKRYQSELRTTLEQNYRLRAMADYKRGQVSEVRAARAVRRAEVFVAAVAEREGRTK
jgi:hypothetical protein